MEAEVKEKIQTAIRAAELLFSRGRVSGSTGNLSFLHGKRMYITASGSCFGALKETDFAVLDLEKNVWEGERKPSKEWPMHRLYYEKSGAVQAVIHTHSPFTTLWSCRRETDEKCVIPDYTPYLEMKVGSVAAVPYAKPGSEELFEAFRAALPQGDAFLLQNHGGIVGGKSIMDAFYGIEEMEESCRIALLTAAAPAQYIKISERS